MLHVDQKSHEEWLTRALPEEVIDPEMPCVDCHHHLWDGHTSRTFAARFMLDEIGADIARSGHNVTHTCYMQVRRRWLFMYSKLI